MMCLAHKSISRRLDPHRSIKRFSLASEIHNLRIHVDLISDYKTGSWKLNRELLRRQVKHFRETKNLQLTLRGVIHRVHKQMDRAKQDKKLPRLLYLPWVNEKLLDPQNLLMFGKKELKKRKQFELEIKTSSDSHLTKALNNESKLTIRMGNIRSLTQEKLRIDKATESLTNTIPDVYIYVESRFKPDNENLQKYRQVFHSMKEVGRGGTTILVKKDININFSETNIPDTVLLVLHKAKTTLVLAGTYLSQRITDKSQKLGLILEMLGKLAGRYNDPTVLLFGDLNMDEHVVHRTLERVNHQIAHLNLRIAENYTSPPSFPQLATRRGINKRKESQYTADLTMF